MDDEKPFDLRDKLAIEILNGLLAGDLTKTGHTGSAELILKYTHKHAADFEKKWGDELSEQLVRAAYMLADKMRQIRSDAFS